VELIWCRVLVATLLGGFEEPAASASAATAADAMRRLLTSLTPASREITRLCVRLLLDEQVQRQRPLPSLKSAGFCPIWRAEWDIGSLFGWASLRSAPGPQKDLALVGSGSHLAGLIGPWRQM
jgi:hypothetical protein